MASVARPCATAIRESLACWSGVNCTSMARGTFMKTTVSFHQNNGSTGGCHGQGITDSGCSGPLPGLARFRRQRRMVQRLGRSLEGCRKSAEAYKRPAGRPVLPLRRIASILQDPLPYGRGSFGRRCWLAADFRSISDSISDFRFRGHPPASPEF